MNLQQMYFVKFSNIEASYTSKEGCRLVWKGVDEDDTHAVILNGNELSQLVEIFKKNSAGRIDLEDYVSTILINSDVTQFNLKGSRTFEANTAELQKKILESGGASKQKKLDKSKPKKNEIFSSFTHYKINDYDLQL